jgi:REP element-mobilizing transposase RayT
VGYDLRVSYTNLLYHIVYGTKDRVPFITKELRPRLHRYLGGLVNGLNGTPLELDGTADHVHVLALIKPVISVSEFLSKLKSNSSGWANRHTRGRFKWQVKYGAFTVSHSQVDRVRRYIRNQETHHSRISFDEEFKALLKSHGIEFEEKYLWG